MAAKYWFVAGNGSSNWNTAGVWYNGSGGTGGVTTTPTAADDAILDAASGSGTLTISATSTCSSLNASTFTGTLAGTGALNIVTLALTGATVLSLGGTLTYSAVITLSGLATSGQILANGKTHVGGITINAPNRSFVFADFFSCNGVFTLTSGTVSGVNISVGSMSLSNSNVRTFQFNDLYLTGSGTLLSVATQTNLTWSVSNIYLTNTTLNAKSMALSNVVACDNIYLQGSGNGPTTISSAASAGIYPNVIISKTGGTLAFGTSSFTSITYIEGSTISWNGTSPVTVYGDVTLCNSMSITTSNSLTFAGGITQTLTTFNKTFTGTLTVDDGGTGTGILIVNGDYTSTSISTNAIAIRACGVVDFNNSVLLASGGISINGSGVTATVNFNSSVTATAVTIAEGIVTLGNTTLTGALTLSSGTLSLYANSIINIGSFVSSSTISYRQIYLGINTIINLTGASGNVWNTQNGIAQGVLEFYRGTSTINIIGVAGSDVNFLGGGITLWDVNIIRPSGPTMSTTFTGNTTFRNLRDLTKLPAGNFHGIQFAFGISNTVTIEDTFQVGNTQNITSIFSSSGTSSFYITKLNPGLVICPNVQVQFSAASPANTWYAISNSVDVGGNTGWIFNDIPRRLGSLGAG
jgi:fibronectin-binding autotransporter adhesin